MDLATAINLGLPLALLFLALGAWRALSRRAFLALALGSALALGAGELVLRALGAAEPGRPEWLEPRTGAAASQPAYVPGGKLVYRYPSDPRGYFGEDHTLVGSINARGLRGPECKLEPTPGRARIAMLGDSFTLGIGVRDEHTLPREVERALGPRTTEVLNFGVSASQTVGQVDYLLGYALRFQPRAVVLVFFLNDAELGSTMGYLTEQRALVALRRRSHLLEGVVGGLERMALRGAMLRHYREGYREDSPGWRDARAALRRAKAELDERGVALVLVLHPVLVDLDAGRYPFGDVHATLADFGEREGIPVVDLLPVLAGNRAEDLWVHSVDRHSNELCNRLTGRAVARELRRLELVP